MFVGSTKKKAPCDSRRDGSRTDSPQEIPQEDIQHAIETRDYSSAVTFIEFLRDELNQPYTKELTHWHDYSLFHSARFSDAIALDEKLLKQEPEDNQEFAEAREAALQGPPCDFRTRLLFHIAHQINDEQGLYQARSGLA
jgi:intraflagellar transport protein 56